MRTPDEIKKGLKCCSKPAHESPCQECPYAPNNGYCAEIKSSDAITLIQQLEAQNAEKAERIRQLEAERDAVIRYIPPRCKYCVRNSPQFLQDGKMDDVCRTCFQNDKCNWQWRGVQEEKK